MAAYAFHQNLKNVSSRKFADLVPYYKKGFETISKKMGNFYVVAGLTELFGEPGTLARQVTELAVSQARQAEARDDQMVEEGGIAVVAPALSHGPSEARHEGCQLMLVQKHLAGQNPGCLGHVSFQISVAHNVCAHF